MTNSEDWIASAPGWSVDQRETANGYIAGLGCKSSEPSAGRSAAFCVGFSYGRDDQRVVDRINFELANSLGDTK